MTKTRTEESDGPEPREKPYRTERKPDSVIEWHHWGTGSPFASTQECVFCGDPLDGTKLPVHLETCEKADREVRY